MQWEKALFVFLSVLAGVLFLHAALNPSPAQRVFWLAQELKKDLQELIRVAKRPARDCEDLRASLVRAAELAQVAKARLTHLEDTLAESGWSLWPSVVFRIEGEDVALLVSGIDAGSLAIGAGGPGLRWDLEAWQLLEIQVMAKGAELLSSNCANGEAHFVVRAQSGGMTGEIVRLKGRGTPVVWLPAPQHVRLEDVHNQAVESFVVVLW